MNPLINALHPYPFEKLTALKAGITPSQNYSPISLSIGEPRHKSPEFIIQAITQHLDSLSTYPLTIGKQTLRQSIVDWLVRRFQLPQGSLDPTRHVLPVNGTREALFAFAQAVIDHSSDPLVMMPNPFYQIYEGAAILAGAQPYYMNITAENNYLSDFDSIPESTWERCQLLYLCTPGNPTGAVIDIDRLQKLISLARQYNFIIASDECYSEIYFDEDIPPPGLLQAAIQTGDTNYHHCIVFHSLSKRSNLPGLRSGFVAGDAEIIKQFFQYRTYHGCTMSPPNQFASELAWSDEQHVRSNRDMYREKFAAVLDILRPILDIEHPQAGFYLWPKIPIDDQKFAKELYQRYNVLVLPGSFLSREVEGFNPGRNYIRMALVGSLDECTDVAGRIKDCINTI